ncbi:MAG: Hsp70 family protein [Phycisphaerales bacterium]|nr:Hsp70 family protein [Phycisphaerales bacterium]
MTGPPASIIGIDLGTTNSLVAVADPRPRILPDERGRNMLPSVVRFNADGSATVGHEAREQAVANAVTTIAGVKRLMGRSVRDAAGDAPFLPFSVVAGEHDTARVAVPAAGGGRVVSPQEVSAIILRTLRAQAERALGVGVSRAVVTVPAYFDDAQRQATRDAGRLAGLEVVRIVNEPTAAALAYGLGSTVLAPGASRTIIVFDLGGGTFDVSILRLTGGETRSHGAEARAAVSDFFQVLATAGDTHLGGDDFDHALVALFSREIAEEFNGGEPLDLPPETRQSLKTFAEAAKIRLSEADTASVRILLNEGGSENRNTPVVYERTITRAEFESLIGPMVDRAIACCKRALRDAKRELDGAAIDAVVMVGGATRTPLVRRRVAEVFGIEPYTGLNPDEVVALGAAVQAGLLAGTAGDEGGRRGLLLDVVPLSLGIETIGGAMAKLIVRNSTVPARAHELFSTSADGQTSIKLNILQGEREMAADCRSLGTYHLRGIPPMPAGIPRLRVEFLVDANGVLSVRAAEERSGKRLDVQIVPNHGLSQEEVERLERESFAHAREDMTRHRIADLVANARLDVKWIEATLARVGADAGGFEPGYIEGLRERVAGLRAMIESGERDWRGVDADAFHHAKEELDRESVRLHEVAIARSLRGDGVG